MLLSESKGYQVILSWFKSRGIRPFDFQEETWSFIIQNRSGLINAPTGCGKTFSVFLGAIIDFINEYPETYKIKSRNHLRLLWIMPLRALAKDIGRAMIEVIEELGMQWQVGIRNGDTEMNERQKQKRQMPEVLIITPESLHLLLAQKNYPEVFQYLRILAVDEWHELLGSKRGVQVELAISRIVHLVGIKSMTDDFTENHQPFPPRGGIIRQLCIWGISATIGNLKQAQEVLISPLMDKIKEPLSL